MIARRRMVFVALGLGVLLHVSWAAAVNIQPHRTHGGPEGTFRLRGSRPTPPLELRLGLTGQQMKDPLLLRDMAGNVSQYVVRDAVTTEATLELGLHERIALGVNVPFHWTRHVPLGGGFALESSTSLGDVLAYATFAVLPRDPSPVGISLTPFVEAPSGSLEKFTGEGGTNYGATLAVDAALGRATMVANVGYRGRSRNDEVVTVLGATGAIDLDDELTYGLGASVVAIPERLEVVGEVVGSSTFQEFGTNKNTAPLEGAAGIRAHFLDGRLTLSAGGGAGILRGYSAPQFRTFVGLHYQVPLKAKPRVAAAPIVRKTITLRGVNFATASHALTPPARHILGENLDWLRREPQLKIRIEGHTDHRGSDAYNQALSERRVNVVLQYFVGNGIERSRIAVFAFGESAPLVPNTTPANLEQNRRVVVQILEYPE